MLASKGSTANCKSVSLLSFIKDSLKSVLVFVLLLRDTLCLLLFVIFFFNIKITQLIKQECNLTSHFRLFHFFPFKSCTLYKLCKDYEYFISNTYR